MPTDEAFEEFLSKNKIDLKQLEKGELEGLEIQKRKERQIATARINAFPFKYYELLRIQQNIGYEGYLGIMQKWNNLWYPYPGEESIAVAHTPEGVLKSKNFGEEDGEMRAYCLINWIAKFYAALSVLSTEGSEVQNLRIESLKQTEQLVPELKGISENKTWLTPDIL